MHCITTVSFDGSDFNLFLVKPRRWPGRLHRPLQALCRVTDHRLICRAPRGAALLDWAARQDAPLILEVPVDVEIARRLNPTFVADMESGEH